MEEDVQRELHRLRDDIKGVHKSIDKTQGALNAHETGCVKAHAASDARFDTIEGRLKLGLWMVGFLTFAELFGIDTAIQTALRAWGLPW